MRKHFTSALAVLAALGLGFFAPDLLKFMPEESGPKVDLSQYCPLSTTPCEQAGATITLEHDVTAPLKPTQIRVEWPDAGTGTLQLELKGVEMEMGIVKAEVTQTEDGSYQGTLLLPVCTADAMTWVGRITAGKKQLLTSVRMAR